MKNEQPALVILIPGFPKDEDDSACLPAQQVLIENINDNYPFVKLIILSFQYPFINAEYSWNDNQVIAFGGRNRGGFARRFLWYRVTKKLNQLKKENNIAGLLSFWAGECAYMGKRWADKNGIKQFCWLMGQDAKKENRFINKIKPAGSELIALSDFISEEFGKNYNIIPQHTIPIGIEPSTVPGNQIKRDVDIICAGSLIPLKQYHLCVTIVREIKKQFPAVKMIICGKGPEEERIKALITENGLSENIALVGEKKHEEVLALMKRSRILLHPSSYEGFGMVCLEALAAGAEVISFCKPMNENIKKWYTVYSTKAMTEKTISLLTSTPDYTPVLPYPIEETTKKIMKLFDL
jgi:glycosyltransferase involved in cell wall biosynthesis